jgi:hypothetical protein
MQRQRQHIESVIRRAAEGRALPPQLAEVQEPE